MRVELPKGNWAELRDASDVTERQRKPVVAAMDAARGDAPPPAPALLELAKSGDRDAMIAIGSQSSMTETLSVIDAAIVALVESWSFAAEISGDGLLDLPIHALDKLRTVCTPLFDELVPNFGPTKGMGEALTENGEPNPHPFGSSNDSRPGVAAAAQ